MARKKITPSSGKDYHKPKVITLADGSKIKERYHNDYGSKPVYPPKVKDPEGEGKKEKLPKMKFPPPKKNYIFQKTWAKFVNNLAARDSFKTSQLPALEVLCDLYVEYYDLEKIIRTEGRVYEAVSRFGKLKKLHPSVGQLDKVRANIRAYSQRLDLFPKKDNSSEADGEEDDWK